MKYKEYRKDGQLIDSVAAGRIVRTGGYVEIREVSEWERYHEASAEEKLEIALRGSASRAFCGRCPGGLRCVLRYGSLRMGMRGLRRLVFFYLAMGALLLDNLILGHGLAFSAAAAAICLAFAFAALKT